MKTKLKIAAFYLLAAILGGCVPSLHPLFTENDLIFDANLIGTWASAEPNERFEFQQTKTKYYECIYIDKDNKSGTFIAGLGKLGNTTYLDIYPSEPNMMENDFYKSHLLSTHSFMKIELSKDILKLCSMSPDGTDKLLKSKPNAVKHETLEDDNGRIVLTAPTKELQKFILKYGADKKAELFGDKDASKFHRIK
ncbi:MAG: hypothetical protein ABSE89_07085 [Sedimentisphaerales bacterium]